MTKAGEGNTPGLIEIRIRFSKDTMRKLNEKTTAFLVFIALLASFRAHISPSKNSLRTRVEHVVKRDSLSNSKTVGLGDDAARFRDPATLLRTNVHGGLEGIPTLRRVPEVLHSQLTGLYMQLLIGFLIMILLRGLHLYTFRVCFRL